MIDLSFSSLISSIVFSNLLLIFLYFIFKNTRLLIELGYKLLSVYLIFTAIRLALPFEFMETIAIKMPEKLSEIMILLESPFFLILDFKISFWVIFLFLWLLGILFNLYKLLKSYYNFRNLITTYGTNVTHNTPYNKSLQDICKLYPKNYNFDVIILPSITTPMVFGMIKPYILFPKDLQLEEQDLHYILAHEVAHFYNKDLILKLMLQLICIFYWWNPFVFLLKKQISIILELRIDSKVTSLPDPKIKIDYLNCLLNASKNRTALPSESAISFCSASDSQLKQRFLMLMNSKTHKKKQFIFSFLIIFIYTFSILFIFEPYYIADCNKDNSFEITKNSSYLILNPNGKYDLYIENEYVVSMVHIDSSFSHLPIYHSRKEVNKNE